MGVLITFAGELTPAYTDPDWEDKYFADHPAESPWEHSHAWHVARAKVETSRFRRLDLGAGLVLVGATLAGSFLFGRVRCLRDLGLTKSPATRRDFHFLAGVTWLSILPCGWWLSQFIHGIIPSDYAIKGMASFPALLIVAIAGSPIVLLGSKIVLYRADFPAPLWSRPIFGPPYIRATGLLVLAVLTSLLLVLDISYEPYFAPVWLLFLYLFLSARAGVVLGERPI